MAGAQDNPAGPKARDPGPDRAAEGRRAGRGLVALTCAALAAGLLAPALVRPAVAQDRRQDLDALLAPLMEHQSLEHFHKASAGYWDLIQDGLPRQTSVDVRVRLAQCLERIGLPLSAAEAYTAALRLGEGLPVYESVLTTWTSTTLRLAGRPLYAVDTVVELPEQGDPFGLEPLRFLRGLSAYRAGDDGRALVAFEDIDAEPALAVRARLLQGVIYARQGATEDAAAALSQAVSLAEGAADPELAHLGTVARLDLARLAYGAGHVEAAIAGYQTAAADAVHGLGARRELAWALLRADRAQEAVALAGPLVDAPVWPPDARLLLATAYLRSDDRKSSRIHLDALKEEIKAHQAAIAAWIERYPRDRAELAVAEFLGLQVPDGLPSPGPLPPGLAARLARDWRFSAAGAQYEAAQAEIARLGSQLAWWRERAIGQALPTQVGDIAQKTLRTAGLRLLDALEAERHALDRLLVDALVVRKMKPKDAAEGLPEWSGEPLPPALGEDGGAEGSSESEAVSP